MFNGLSNAHLYTALQIGVEFQLRDQAAFATKSGTAFCVRNRAGVSCIVTNRHMLDAGYNEPSGKFLGATLSSLWIDGFQTTAGDANAKPVNRVTFDVQLAPGAVRFAANYFEDVACLINPVVRVRGGGLVSIGFFVDSDYLADDTWIEQQLSICDFVAFPGFPPWHDRLENRPILRTGTISSDPRANYSDTSTSKGRRIAYEAFSFGGSSGSPVFATEKGIRSTAEIITTGFREGRLVGINAGHLEGDYQAHSGISFFVKSSAILELINGDA